MTFQTSTFDSTNDTQSRNEYPRSWKLSKSIHSKVQTVNPSGRVGARNCKVFPHLPFTLAGRTFNFPFTSGCPSGTFIHQEKRADPAVHSYSEKYIPFLILSRPGTLYNRIAAPSSATIEPLFLLLLCHPLSVRSLIWINEPSPNRFQLHYNGRIQSPLLFNAPYFRVRSDRFRRTARTVRPFPSSLSSAFSAADPLFSTSPLIVRFIIIISSRFSLLFRLYLGFNFPGH